MRNRKLFIKIALILSVLMGSIFLLTGCVRGMSPIGWSGVLVNGQFLYTGSKDGKLVSVDTGNNNSINFAESLRPVSTGSSCTSSSNGSGCAGSPPAVAIYGTPASANVQVLGDLIYIAGYNGKIFAYDAKNIKQQRWAYPVEGNLAPIVSSIAVSRDTLYFGCTDFNLYALDTSTGSLKWKFATGGEIWASPLIDNNTVFIGSFDKNIYAVDATTGVKKWQFPTQANNVATAIALDGIIYVGSLDRNLYAIDETTGQQVWKISGGNWFWARPVALNGNIVAPNLDSKVYIVNAKTGANPTAIDVGGQVASWPVVVNNEAIVATENGKLLALSANPASPTQRPIATILNNVTAPLSAGGDIVYINGPDNFIYGYNIATGTQLAPISLKSQ